MPPSEIDIFRSANLLIKEHGEAADFVASTKADEMLEIGDVDGQRVWMKILSAIKELQNTVPEGPLH